MTDASLEIIEDYQWLHPPAAGWRWEFGVCLLAWLVFLAAFAWYWRRRKKLGLTFFPPPPPHEAALRSLQEWEPKLSEENQLEFIVAVSHVVRGYIQGRFGLRAPHRSTEEFLREVHEGDRLLRDHQELLGAFLADCDLVKFAQRRVHIAQMTQLLESARRFVETTAQPLQSQSAEGKGA